MQSLCISMCLLFVFVCFSTFLLYLFIDCMPSYIFWFFNFSTFLNGLKKNGQKKNKQKFNWKCSYILAIITLYVPSASASDSDFHTNFYTLLINNHLFSPQFIINNRIIVFWFVFFYNILFLFSRQDIYIISIISFAYFPASTKSWTKSLYHSVNLWSIYIHHESTALVYGVLLQMNIYIYSSNVLYIRPQQKTLYTKTNT